MKVIWEAEPSDPGMDHWTYTDMLLVDETALDQLANLLSLIEAGKPWPTNALPARSCLRSKNPESPYDAMEYRLLLVTSVLYRIWGKARLGHLHAWIGSWRLPHMHGGLPGTGAEEA
eukprot:4875110-Karenia_brevis.AAC.1